MRENVHVTLVMGALMLLCAAFVAPCAVAAEDDEPEFLNADTAKPGWVPLKLELPKPMFVGTPKDIKSANLEPITGKKRKPFLVPEGLTNVAFEKAVTGSDMEPIIGDMEQVTDGEKEGADGYFVEYGPGLQYVQIDLGETYELYAVLIWHYHSQARVYYDVVVRTAEDKDFITGVKTLFNNDHDNSSGLGVGKEKEYIETNDGKLIDAGGTRARFIRLYSNGNTSDDMNHYIEVEVYGKKPE
ncbi:MAG: hypothetical protein JXR94_15030 [Candidatus Hydrogenedentes bacterium]|nr:hypothetical protein [Candidatus Hydrogenedentota bacterium]